MLLFPFPLNKQDLRHFNLQSTYSSLELYKHLLKLCLSLGPQLILISLQYGFCSLSGGGVHSNNFFVWVIFFFCLCFVVGIFLCVVFCLFFSILIDICFYFPHISVYHAILSHELSQKT